jgi:hypothetical protein
MADRHLEAFGGRGLGGDEKARYWRRQVAAWRRSGGSQADYCRRNGLSKHQFIYWKSKLADEGQESLALVEVPRAVVPEGERGYAAELEQPVVIEVGSYRLKIRSGFCRQTLSMILDDLEGRQ